MRQETLNRGASHTITISRATGRPIATCACGWRFEATSDTPNSCEILDEAVRRHEAEHAPAAR